MSLSHALHWIPHDEKLNHFSPSGQLVLCISSVSSVPQFGYRVIICVGTGEFTNRTKRHVPVIVTADVRDGEKRRIKSEV